MNVFHLSLGSNVEPEKYLPQCIKILGEKFESFKYSTIYETDPVGPAGDLKFWNCSATVKTDLSREELLQELRKIESSLGRVRSDNKYAPRTIDVDILPQKDYQHLAFIMVPLAEIAPDDIDEETGEKFSELAKVLMEEAKSFRKVEI